MMQPVFQININGNALNERAKARLLSLQVTDEAGTDSDAMRLVFEDSDEQVAWPLPGADVEIWLGVDASSLTRMGNYTVDELEYSGPPNRMTIRGKAANMIASLKAPKSRSWTNILLGDLVDTIAAQQGLQARVSEVLASQQIEHRDQTDESDLHFLTRLAKELGAISKPTSGFWLFVVKGEAKSASGLSLAPIDMTREMVKSFRMTQAERGKYLTVRAHFHNVVSGEKESIDVGSGEPAYTLRHTYDTSEQALSAAQAQLKSFNRGTATLSLDLLGDPNLLAESPLNLIGLREPLRGRWSITRVEHEFSSSGFVSRLSAETPND